MRNKKLIAFVGFLLIMCSALTGYYIRKSPPPTPKTSKPVPLNTVDKNVLPKPTQAPMVFNKNLFSLDDPTSYWVVVNKLRPLQPKDYVPSDLTTPNVPLRLSPSSSEMHIRLQVGQSLEKMFTAAKADGISLMIASGYRSYQLQTSIYNANVVQLGQAGADQSSARPGTSEHQTGLAIDIEPTSRQCEVMTCFGDLAEGKWLAANAYKYGFIIRYTKTSQSVTGYEYEPWHIRYVGIELSTELQSEHVATLEEFFNLPSYQKP
ncbi:MAG: M15 family metallopeptidase [Candidatus Saccharimonadales bacterium]